MEARQYVGTCSVTGNRINCGWDLGAQGPYAFELPPTKERVLEVARSVEGRDSPYAILSTAARAAVTKEEYESCRKKNYDEWKKYLLEERMVPSWKITSFVE